MSATLLAAAAEAAGHQQYPAGCLYVVATPIGNLADLSLRALHVLQLVDAVACEDTRVSGQLLRHFGLHKPLLAVHEHNEREAAGGVVSRLLAGERVALVSDAGTPAISDPGARLVAAVQQAGLRCMPVAGASAVAAALSVAGDTKALGFRFLGFLPVKGDARKQALQGLVGQAQTQVLYEAPHRVEALLDELALLAPTQPLTMARELSKQFEQVLTLPVASWPAQAGEMARQGQLRGEFAWLLHAAPPVADEGIGPAAERLLAALLPHLPLKQAAALVAEHCGAARNAVYARALEMKQQAD
ncbi:16S rRNA (cytidine(1402)-2'-O)-methyltransferase [Inhella sp.]|uniref:16S rRNA (cytidine(1402)-2'-O)-methyltransferase n=1 Tax=Inhella sp. TaxID=1921806 RepID=UPI0035B4F65E